ncbi:MAG: hypothetical protein D6750_00535, partial [Bacteroidetes bacterium]
MRKFWIGVGCWVGLWAQEERVVTPVERSLPRARVTGRLIEAATGEPLAGVQVTLSGHGTLTTDKGYFSLPYERPDTLRAFLLGYVPLRVYLARPMTDLILRLTPIEATVDTVIVIAEAARESEAGIFLERLRSLEIGELYSQEAILKRSTDFYVPNALRRMPGVSLLSGRFVSIRGLSERYNSFAFWAAYPAWTRYDGTFGEVEELITTLLGRVEVRKSWTPDLLGHFGG